MHTPPTKKESGQNPAHYAPVIMVIAKQKRGKACKFAYEIEGGKSSLLKWIRIKKNSQEKCWLG